MHVPSQILFNKNSSPSDLHTMTLGCCADEKVNIQRQADRKKTTKCQQTFVENKSFKI